MKKILKTIMVIIVCFTISANAQTIINNQMPVPTPIKNAFMKDYPNTSVKWGAEGGNYEAEFKLNGVDASATYNKDGHRESLEITIKTQDLPPPILPYVHSNYGNYKIIETAKITSDKNVVTFEVEVKNAGKSFDLLFDENGGFIKKEIGD